MESSGYREQKGLPEASVLVRGKFSKVFLKDNKLRAGLRQSVVGMCQELHRALYLSFQTETFGSAISPLSELELRKGNSLSWDRCQPG